MFDIELVIFSADTCLIEEVKSLLFINKGLVSCSTANFVCVGAWVKKWHCEVLCSA